VNDRTKKWLTPSRFDSTHSDVVIKELREIVKMQTTEGEMAMAVVEAVVQLGNDCRYAANDWVLSPELAQKYVEPVYQQALTAQVD